MHSSCMILTDSPIDLTKEILEEKGYGIDEEGFQKQWKNRSAKHVLHVK